ncbi:hypothetical protein AVEN_66269-1 [Araneus ventricosus]|uniref:Uncharacterized protein n=1 Tax=Araneus ventricosus TaxID=182803 RepID=A0A4Y2TPC9_ARAVE|nr:hypothetical protein AVEN_66269-1 [Araneus ventricosus]
MTDCGLSPKLSVISQDPLRLQDGILMLSMTEGRRHQTSVYATQGTDLHRGCYSSVIDLQSEPRLSYQTFQSVLRYTSRFVVRSDLCQRVAFNGY